MQDWRQSLAFEPMMSGTSLWVCALVVVCVLFVLWRASGTLNRRQRMTLAGLRFLLGAGLLVTLLGPGIRHERVTSVPGTVLVLVDRSRSMDTKARRAAVSRLVSEASIESLQREFSVLKFSFSRSIEPLELNSLGQAPNGKQTYLLASIEEAAAAVQGSPLAGIVVLTDGVSQERAEDLKGRVRELDVPLLFLAPNASKSRDLSLSMAGEAPVAFVRNTRTLKVALSGRGVSGMEATIKVQIPGVADQLKRVKLVGDPARVELEIPFKPMRVGRQVIRLSTPVVSGEEDISNNVLLVPMDVVRDRLRVLLVAGAPTWDVRYLRRLLKEDPGVDLVSFFILRTHEDSSTVPEEELSLIPFPERELFEEQLHTFDVVLFVDFNYAPYSVGRYLGHIRRFVEVDGGGFAMVGGERSFFEGQYQDTEIGRLLPVEIASATADLRPFVPLAVAPNHPILSLGQSADVQDQLASLPLLRGRNRLGDPKPGAAVILAHPEHTKTRQQPVLVAAPVGRGRALALAVDSLWRWQLPAAARRQTARPYYRIWHNMLRWLSGDPAFSRLTWDDLPASVGRGASLPVRLSLRGQDWLPQANAVVDLSLRQKGQPERRLQSQTDEAGQVQFDVQDLAPGDWTLKASSSAEGRQVARAEAIVIAGQPSLERRLVGPDHDRLKRLADASDGEVYDWDTTQLSDLAIDKDRKGERIEAMRQEPLWTQPWWILILLTPGFIAIALRRRWQLV